MEATVERIVSELAARGQFGAGQYLSVGPDPQSQLAFQLGSEIVFLEVRFDDRSLPLVVKRQMTDKEMREARDMGTMFYNEVTMYQDVLPYLKPDEAKRIYPKFFYGVATNGQDWDADILIIENIKPLGFKLNPEKSFIDFKHVALAMERIGEFHSWSYTAKHRDLEGFTKVVNKLRKVVNKKTGGFDFEEFNFQSMELGITPFITKGVEVEVLKRYLEIIRQVENVMDFLQSPTEPFAAVIHGDFCKNNLFYKYEREDEPTDCAMFDLQLSKYGCPVIDLSFFLYMHTTAELRAAHWDDFLEIYWKSVEEHVSSEVQLPTFQEFLDYFAKKAVYGYFPSSFFLPIMLFGTYKNPEDFKDITPEEKNETFLTMGGEYGVKVRCDIVQHLIERKYIHSFIQFYEENSHMKRQ